MHVKVRAHIRKRMYSEDNLAVFAQPTALHSLQHYRVP